MKDNFMENIKIYNSEKNDGLTNLINNNVLSFASSITNLEAKPDVDPILYAKAEQIFKSLAKNIEQPDLVHKYSILASVGWNANDDVFNKQELWNARSTPVDKQVNFMHDELKIIGHMTESFILDENRNLLKTQSETELPDKFDIGVGFVLYKMWEDKERSELMERVIAEMESGNWFVSMECRFPDFDYAVIDKSGNHKTIARSEETSFLTKYLRSYGGSGIYQDYKIGRLLKGLFFSGKGIVDNPANKRSEIINNTTFLSTGNLKIREVKMEELDKIKAELEQIKAENKKLSQELTEKVKASIAAEVESIKASKEAVEKVLASVKEELAVANVKVTETNANLTKVIAEAKAAKDDCENMEKEMAKMKADIAKANRISQLVKVGLDEAKATEVYAKFASLADDQFSEIVPLYKVTKSMDSSDDVDDETDDASASTADLSKAELEGTVANTTTTTDAKTFEEKFTSLANSLTQFMPLARASKTNK